MKKVAFILDGFELQSPGQQLLDRFLMGWSENGACRPGAERVVVWGTGLGENPHIQKRVKDFHLELATSWENALDKAELTILAPGTSKLPNPDRELILRLLETVPDRSACYVDASLALSSDLTELGRLSNSRSVTFMISRAAAHFIPLPVAPPIPPFRTTSPNAAKKVLLLGHGPYPEAELDAFYALTPFGVPESVGISNRLTAPEIEEFLYLPPWRPLLAAAVSRSNTIQGDPEKDGRTQDIVGLQMIGKLAQEPRCWQITGEGTQITLLVLNGALADFNLAFEAAGKIHSAQLYCPPAPAREHFSALATSIADTALHKGRVGLSGEAARALMIAKQICR